MDYGGDIKIERSIDFQWNASGWYEVVRFPFFYYRNTKQREKKYGWWIGADGKWLKRENVTNSTDRFHFFFSFSRVRGYVDVDFYVYASYIAPICMVCHILNIC